MPDGTGFNNLAELRRMMMPGGVVGSGKRRGWIGGRWGECVEIWGQKGEDWGNRVCLIYKDATHFRIWVGTRRARWNRFQQLDRTPAHDDARWGGGIRKTVGVDWDRWGEIVKIWGNRKKIGETGSA